MIKKVREKIKGTIKEHNLIEKGDSVILGLSGGPDSLCLFDVLLGLSEEMDFTLYCAHINHGFRPGAADEDQSFVEKLCAEKNIVCRTKKEDCNRLAEKLKITGEEAGRKVRYDFFRETGKELISEGVPEKSIKVAIAHNRDDQSETIMFRILRGTGTDGLAGIDYRKRDERGSLIIRPLLDVPRNEIEEYCRLAELHPRIDHTNLIPVYGRNRIRLNLLPYLEENFNGNIKEALVRMGEIAREDRDFLWQCANEAFEKALVSEREEEIVFSQEKLAQLASPVRTRVLFQAYSRIGLPQDISHVHIKEAEKLILEEVTPHETCFPKGYVLGVAYGEVRCAKGQEEEKQETVPEIKVTVSDAGDYDRRPETASFDLHLMEQELGRENVENLIHIRTREQGDYIRLPGMKGRKKIQDLFVDMKVPKHLRDRIFLVAAGHEVLWIPKGKKIYDFKGRYSGNYKVTETTKKVITVEISGIL